jgi:hypothetical protein
MRKPWRACLIPDLLASRLLRATPRETPAGRHLDLKPDHRNLRSAGGSGASPPGSPLMLWELSVAEQRYRAVLEVGTGVPVAEVAGQWG